jgi:hypothetical protein
MIRTETPLVCLFVCILYLCFPYTGRSQTYNTSLNGTIDQSQNQKFRIRIDTSVNSEMFRQGDIVQFTVLEDILGTVTETKYNKTESIEYENEVPKTVIKYEKAYSSGDKYVAVPKGSIGFGYVFSARKRSPLSVKGKSQIFVAISEIKFIGGGDYDRVEIEFADEFKTLHSNLLPCDPTVRKARQKLPGKTKDAPKQGDQCIEGRRPAIDWTSAITTSLIAAGLSWAKDDVSYPVAGITLLNKASGFSDVLNGTNAQIPSGLIFVMETGRMIRKGEPSKQFSLNGRIP